MAKRGLLSRIFSGAGVQEPVSSPIPTSADEPATTPGTAVLNEYSARIAVYDTFTASPFIVDIGSHDFLRVVDEISAKAYNLGRERGGKIPYIVIREVVENLIHAGFKDVVITVEPDGNVIRISDHGPGILDKDRAFMPGFTTASSDVKKMIKGVGSGLPIVKESLELMGGCVILEDNLSSGLVITLKGSRFEKASEESQSKPLSTGEEKVSDSKKPDVERVSDEDIENKVSSRQKKVLMLLAEAGPQGPSSVAKELGLSAATAYRDLELLEKLDLIATREGKREITLRGQQFINFAMKRQ